ncbi:MAG: tetratricopeptide repeat protein [Gallionella sp.]|nr:tetratricopeptide repeat protein [Gallionella sp.]
MKKSPVLILLSCLILFTASFPAIAWQQTDIESTRDASNAYDAGDYAKASLLYSLLAKQGNAVAQFNLGVMYERGQHLPRNAKEAIQWYLLAAEQGYAPAQFRLGRLFAKGKAVPQDYARASSLYLAAAEQGHAPAQISLGVMYEKGVGVLQNHQLATHWYQMAAAQGDPTAQRNLAEAYNAGRGVPQDPVRAYMWMNIAAANAKTSIARTQYVERLASMAGKMSTEQLTQARSLVASCAASNYKGC